MNARPRLLFLITEDWYFWSHRLDLARAARDAGFAVSIATRVTDHGERIRQEGFRLFPLRLRRRSRNPFAELGAAGELVRIYRLVKPHLVHHVALKPILYGAFAAWLTHVPAVVHAFAGLGYLFTADHRMKPPQRFVFKWLLTAALAPKRSVVVFQNRDDRDRFVEEGIVPIERTRVIAGSGIDTALFHPTETEPDVPIVLLASRMLWDKGVGDFVEAARALREKGVQARFVLAGRCDDDNPAAIPLGQLYRWRDEGLVEWWGYREDMPAVLGAATVVVLPSYREGLPKVLLEAAACAKPLIATDVPGCREIVRHGWNGLLVPPHAPADLAKAIELVLTDPTTRKTMGEAARELVLQEFSSEKITGQVIALYREMLLGLDSTLPLA